MISPRDAKCSNKIRFYAKMTDVASGTGNTLKSGYPKTVNSGTLPRSSLSGVCRPRCWLRSA